MRIVEVFFIPWIIYCLLSETGRADGAEILFALSRGPPSSCNGEALHNHVYITSSLSSALCLFSSFLSTNIIYSRPSIYRLISSALCPPVSSCLPEVRLPSVASQTVGAALGSWATSGRIREREDGGLGSATPTDQLTILTVRGIDYHDYVRESHLVPYT